MKVILIGHHPPGSADNLITTSRMYIELAREFSDVIVLHIAGHTHFDEFRLVSLVMAKGCILIMMSSVMSYCCILLAIHTMISSDW